jgi:hypothetical protein
LVADHIPFKTASVIRIVANIQTVESVLLIAAGTQLTVNVAVLVPHAVVYEIVVKPQVSPLTTPYVSTVATEED